MEAIYGAQRPPASLGPWENGPIPSFALRGNLEDNGMRAEAPSVQIKLSHIHLAVGEQS